jgi:Tfp pilus assembly protein PilN
MKQPVTASGGGGNKLNLNFGSLSSFGKITPDMLKELPLKKLIIPIIVGVGAYYYLDNLKTSEIQKLEDTLKGVSEEAAKVQKKIDALKGYEKVQKEMEEDEKILRSKIDTIQGLSKDRDRSFKLLASIVDMVPSQLWLSTLKVDKTEIKMDGGARGLGQISDFMKNLRESAYFENVNLITSNEVTETQKIIEMELLQGSQTPEQIDVLKQSIQTSTSPQDKTAATNMNPLGIVRTFELNGKRR